MDLTDLVEKYIKLRDKKSLMKAAYEKQVADVDAMMDKIESALLKTFNQAGGLNSISSPAGTAYKSIRTSASVADKDTYTSWILEQPEERLVFLDVRANKSSVEQYRAEHDDIPPGLNWREEVVINVRRS